MQYFLLDIQVLQENTEDTASENTFQSWCLEPILRIFSIIFRGKSLVFEIYSLTLS